ncbi:MAG: aldo/keto reductase [Pirellulales bacterium]|nr:aldo/keto reductase [Pirellulales bacterium]
MDKPIDRRRFVRSSALLVAGAAAASAPGSDQTAQPDSSDILNYHPSMRYRPLGRTGLILSEVSLGGHWRNRGPSFISFPGDEVPAAVVEHRTAVVSAAIDAVMNYLDITTAAECLAYGAALQGRREKMIIGADDHRLCPRNPANRNVKTQMQNVDECLRRLKTDYLDIWRVQACQAGGHPDSEVAVWIEAFQKIRAAGKARHFGISAHARPWIQHVVEMFPEVEMVIFPCTARTREKGQAITEANIEEGAMPEAWSSDRSKSIFQSVRERNVGLVTIKPFIGGQLFPPLGEAGPAIGAGNKDEHDLARLTLQSVLANDAITAVVPGMDTAHQVATAARAAADRSLGMTPAEQAWLAESTARQWDNLPERYHWLRDWELV